MICDIRSTLDVWFTQLIRFFSLEFSCVSVFGAFRFDFGYWIPFYLFIFFFFFHSAIRCFYWSYLCSFTCHFQKPTKDSMGEKMNKPIKVHRKPSTGYMKTRTFIYLFFFFILKEKSSGSCRIPFFVDLSKFSFEFTFSSFLVNFTGSWTLQF